MIYIATITGERNGVLFAEHKQRIVNGRDNLTAQQAGEIIQVNTNSAMRGCNIKYKIVCTNLEKVK